MQSTSHNHPNLYGKYEKFAYQIIQLNYSSVKKEAINTLLMFCNILNKE